MSDEKGCIMKTAKTARRFLTMNAAFSLLVGVDFLLAPRFAADILFVAPGDWQVVTLRLLGGGLILFGLDLLLMVRMRFLSKAMVLFISVLDVGWIAASAGVLALYGSLFTPLGQAAVVAIAAFVAVFAVGQFIGARRMEPPLSKASVTLSDNKIVAAVDRPVHAPQDVVWRVMSDHPGYADVADNLSKVEVVKGEGVGMLRRCYGPKGESWLETCDLYQEGQAFGFRVHTEAADYPYPISDLRGRWSVTRHGTESKFAIRIEATPQGGLLARTLFKAMAKWRFKVVLADLADAWAERMEREAHA